MKLTKQVRFGNIAIAAITGLLLTLPIQAEMKSDSSNLIVQQPGDLPEMAQMQGQSMFLHAAGNGTTYLYVEQQNGARLAVFDVTDPANIKTEPSVALNTAGAFDFVHPLNDHAELIRFRDNQQVAVLDLHRPQTPTLKIENALNEPGHTESLQAGFLTSNGLYMSVKPAAQEFPVIDVGNPADSIRQVRNTVVNQETGTTYLLASDGLTVVRSPGVEEDYKAHQIQMLPN